ncbi:MAG: adenosine deaminase [Prochlorococcaceae cyanobacterium]
MQPLAPGLTGLLIGALGLAPAIAGEASVAAWLERHRERPGAVRAFVQRLPKGADLHSHLSGAVYAERYLEWAAADGFCVDPAKPALVAPGDCGRSGTLVPASELLQQPALHNRLIDAWSTRNLAFAGRSGHDQFFEAFGGFDLIASSPSRQDDMVAEVANRAAAQHIHHLELMLTVQGRAVRQLGAAVGWNGDAERTRQRLLAAGLLDLVEQGRQQIDTLTRDTARTLGCGTPAAQPGCGVTVRFLQQSQRTRPPAEVFAQLVYAFELARASSSVVGINLVAPEDHPQALRDYTLQMRMLQALKARSPETRVALHAGELRLGLVPPERLRYHIRQAVELAGAERIGHGVAVMTEEEPFQLLREMARRGVLVEICLTSNDVILDVKGPDHPLQEYRKAGVPVALASDDEGISRIDLSHEFMLAVQRHGLGYRDLKQLARNSLQHSFLPGASLWSSACAGEPLGAASPSAACSRVLAGSERARAQWRLEAELARFERLPDFQGADP